MDVIFRLTDIFFGFRYCFLTRFPALKNKNGIKKLIIILQLVFCVLEKQLHDLYNFLSLCNSIY